MKKAFSEVIPNLFLQSYKKNLLFTLRSIKKVGEEATEIVIAAKNPNPEEIKYEISDFLYHAMVLMVKRGVTWEDIINELADR